MEGHEKNRGRTQNPAPFHTETCWDVAKGLGRINSVVWQIRRQVCIM